MRAFRKVSYERLGLLAMVAALCVLSLPEPGRAQSGSFCRWEPVGNDQTAGAYVCDPPSKAPGGLSIKPPDPCFIQQNAMRPCTSPPAQNNTGSAGTYAATAISPSSLDTGTSWGAASSAEAEQLAIQFCAKQGNNKDCKSLTWAKNACVAIAISHGTGHNDGTWGSSWNGNLSTAKARAISLCTTAKNKDCKVQQSACSNDP